MTGTRIVAALVAVLVLCLAATAGAQTDGEASRQLELAEQDLAAGNYERAATAAASALRLDPSLVDALVVKGLAYKELGRLEDAENLLRTYLDLRGSLPVDERVPAALMDLEGQLESAGGGDRVLLLFGPGGGDGAEAALEAGRRFLRGATPAGATPLQDLVRGAARGVEVHGATSTPCLAPAERRTPADLAVIAAETAEPEQALALLEPGLAIVACGAGGTRDDVARLLATRASLLWRAGRVDEAQATWTELLQLAPAWRADPLLDADGEAAFSAARAAAAQAERVQLASVVHEGWRVLVDGSPVVGVAELPAGTRSVRIEAPDGTVAGALVELRAGRPVVVGTADQLVAAALDWDAPGPALALFSSRLDEVMARDRIDAALLVGLFDRPVVRRYERREFLLLTAPPRRQAETETVVAAPDRRAVGAVVLGGGLAVTAVGAILAAVAHADGVDRMSTMDTAPGFVEGWSAYEQARTLEQAGVGIAAAGGVVTVAGAITIVIPQGGKKVRR